MAALLVVRLTGMLQLYTLASEANMPTMKPNEKILLSNLPQPKRNDFIGYTIFDSEEHRHYVVVHRLCAAGGDVVAIRNGVLFVNGANADEGLTLKHLYSTTKAEAAKIADEFPEDERIIADERGDTALVSLDDAVAKNGHWKVSLYLPADSSNPYFHLGNRYHHPGWTTENFGPVTVPPDTYFILGDNRDNALDSRYRGFTPVKDVAGVKVW